jgi:hypothetical protein
MQSYKLKFENGRCCTVECDNKISFQDKINQSEKRFNSECVEINDQPIKKHSLGGFIIGATLGFIVGKNFSKPKSSVNTKSNNPKFKSTSKTSNNSSTKSSRSRRNPDDIFQEREASKSRKSKKDPDDIFQERESKYATGGKSDSAPRWWNKQVRPYMFFVFNTETNKVWAGNEYQEDAKDELKEFLESNPKLPLKVLTKRAITNKKINPLAYENWARSTEQLDAIRKFADGGGVDDERYCRLANDTGKGINEGYVIGDGDMYFETEKGLVDYLRENYLPKSKLTDKQLLKKAYDDEYYYYTEWEGESEIEDQGYYYTEDGKEIELASKGKKFALGGSMMVASAVSNRLPATTSAIDKRMANRIYSERPSRWEDRGLRYKTGGGVQGVEWDKDSDGYRTKLGGFDLRITPATQKGYWDIFVGESQKTIGKKHDIYGIENAKNKAYDIISRYHKYSDQYEDNETDDISLWSDGELAMYLGVSELSVSENREDAVEQAIELRKMSNEGFYAKGGGIRMRNGREYSFGRAWTNDHNHQNKKQNYEVPMNNRKSKFATGGTVGQEITFKHWSGDVRTGSITEDLGNGNFEVSSGFGSVLVNKNDIISGDKKFATGGSTTDEFEDQMWWVSSRASKGKYTVMRGDFMSFVYDNKEEAIKKARKLNQIWKRK